MTALVDRYQEAAVALVKLALEQTPPEASPRSGRARIAADPALRSLQRRRRLQPAGTAAEQSHDDAEGSDAWA